LSLLPHEPEPADFNDSFCLSLARALAQSNHHHDTTGSAVPPSPSHEPEDVRELVVACMIGFAMLPFPELQNKTPKQWVRSVYFNTADPRALAFADDRDARTPASWREYTSLMILPECIVDRLFIITASVLYKCQIFLINDDCEVVIINPLVAHRRVFILFNDSTDSFYSWAHECDMHCPQAAECRTAARFDIFLAAPALAPIPEGPVLGPVPPPPSLDDSIPVASRQHQWICNAHCGYTGHPGVQATLSILRSQRHIWKGMTAHVAQYIKRCPTCISSRIRLNPAMVSTATLRINAMPLRRWHIDSTGIMSTCAFTGFTRCIVFRDESTGFTIFAGSRFGCGLETAIGFLHVSGFFGLPDSLHSDGGPENDNYTWHQFQQITGIKHTLSLPAQPHSNAIAESAIKTSKRFLKTLCVDLGRHNAWGLHLGIVQHAVNSLPNAERQCTPNQLVFSSFYNPFPFVIPTTYHRQSAVDDDVDVADANHYSIAANLVHSATYIQQLVTNRYHEHMDLLVEQASAKDPLPSEDIPVGEHVMIAWPLDKPPSPQHPGLRGPFTVIARSRNVLTLQHLSHPLPADQPSLIKWSKHAHVYSMNISDNDPIMRSLNDPAASQVPADFQTQHIECVIRHSLKLDFHGVRLPDTVNHVSQQDYVCRMWKPVLLHSDDLLHTLTYDQVRHTYAFDSYYVSHPSTLHGHTPIAHMPAGWHPHGVDKALRPWHSVALPNERDHPHMSDPDEVWE